MSSFFNSLFGSRNQSVDHILYIFQPSPSNISCLKISLSLADFDE